MTAIISILGLEIIDYIQQMKHYGPVQYDLYQSITNIDLILTQTVTTS